MDFNSIYILCALQNGENGASQSLHLSNHVISRVAFTVAIVIFRIFIYNERLAKRTLNEFFKIKFI